MSRYLTIILGQADTIALRFAVRDNELARLWLDKMQARSAWPLDDPQRFYGFGDSNQERQTAHRMLLDCVETIRGNAGIIDREFTSIDDQDYLNYLHHVFETYHGLLDQQDHEFWKSAPDVVRRALANLNIAIHRCESTARGSAPRFVCTWFGMPKTDRLTKQQIQTHGDTQVQFGGVYLNYVEIGKTIEHLAEDNDLYIGQDAFQPFRHYSADFFVSFFDRDYKDCLPGIQQYYHQHQEFFRSQGIDHAHDADAMPYRFPVADLEDQRPGQELLALISQRQYIQQVIIE